MQGRLNHTTNIADWHVCIFQHSATAFESLDADRVVYPAVPLADRFPESVLAGSNYGNEFDERPIGEPDQPVGQRTGVITAVEYIESRIFERI
jgi:hypothetical protein